MSAQHPRITIVTPSYNQDQFLERTIVSVLEQGYPNLEYIVMDGGSTDQSLEIIKRYARYFAYWVSEKDGGQAEAINRGLKLSTGEILGWLNSDDRLEPNALEIVAAHAKRFPAAGAFVGHGRRVDTSGCQITYTDSKNLSFERICNWLTDGHFIQPSCFFRRKAWDLAGPLDESLYFALDLDLWLRMARQVSFQPIDALLSTALFHPAAKTVASRPRMIVEAAFVVMRAGGAEYVREPLEELAARVERYEAVSQQLLGLPLARSVWRLVRPFLNHRARP
jgi:glycosyltransferase involved in cell wall biosynthesis